MHYYEGNDNNNCYNSIFFGLGLLTPATCWWKIAKNQWIIAVGLSPAFACSGASAYQQSDLEASSKYALNPKIHNYSNINGFYW